MKKALITGITGQDGSYLAEFLLKKGYRILGLCRRSSVGNIQRIAHIEAEIDLAFSDLTDTASLRRLIEKFQPDEIYNLGAQANVALSFSLTAYTTEVNGAAVARLLEALVDTMVPAKFYQASSSEVFGKVRETPQNEKTPFHPRSPYGFSKAMAHWATVNAREAHGIFACNGILFNHESPRRSEQFVTKKITTAVQRIYQHKQEKLLLGNLAARRDWGYAPEYVEGMWLMLQQARPDDYVIATGDSYSVEEFAKEAFSLVGLDYKQYVRQDIAYYRPADVDTLIGDASKAKRVLGWEPKVRFKELVRLMMESYEYEYHPLDHHHRRSRGRFNRRHLGCDVGETGDH